MCVIIMLPFRTTFESAYLVKSVHFLFVKMHKPQSVIYAKNIFTKPTFCGIINYSQIKAITKERVLNG